ncbi:MAG: hypothetical protein ACKPKO_25970, partial [Candidatus Fonsibacter sp.]
FTTESTKVTHSHFDNAWDLHMISNTVGEPVFDQVNLGVGHCFFTTSSGCMDSKCSDFSPRQINFEVFALVLVGEPLQGCKNLIVCLGIPSGY